MTTIHAEQPGSPVSFRTLIADGVLDPIHQAFGESLQRLARSLIHDSSGSASEDRPEPAGAAASVSGSASVSESASEAGRGFEGEAHPDVILAAALCSEQLTRGHVCLELDEVPRITFQTGEKEVRTRSYDNWPDISRWMQHLQDSPLVTVASGGVPGTRETRRNNLAAPATPLVLDPRRRCLYLSRYWYFEQHLGADMANRIRRPNAPLDDLSLQRHLHELFPERDSSGSRDQYAAVRNAVARSFCVITGGPGTGKTTTVARLLALRLLLDADAGRDPEELKILLMAPTGKAAQRLNESLGRATDGLKVDASVRRVLQKVRAATIHRVLGWTPLPPERGGPFRHNARLPLDADVVLIDEASMVDLALMDRLFDAIPETAQVVLIGDRDQLASVEAGSVLGELCAAASDSHARDASDSKPPAPELTSREASPGRPRKKSRKQSTAASKQLTLFEGTVAENSDAGEPEATLPPEATPSPEATLSPAASADGPALAGSIFTLRHSHRFASGGALDQLADSIREGRDDEVISLLRDANSHEIRWLRDASGKSSSELIDQTAALAAVEYQEFLQKLHDEPSGNADILQDANRARILCAHRNGPRGETAMNRKLISRLTAAGYLRGADREAPGRLVMVTRNDYRLNVFNGDVGIIVEPEDDSPSGASRSSGGPPSSGTSRLSGTSRPRRMILFEDPEEETGVRPLPASLISGIQDCFAMTIHKSQGSEFHNVFLMLPEHDSPVLTRELLYTAVTRVKEQFDQESGEKRPGFLCITGSESVVRSTVRRSVRRASGIRPAIETRLAGTVGR